MNSIVFERMSDVFFTKDMLENFDTIQLPSRLNYALFLKPAFFHKGIHKHRTRSWR